MTEIADLERLMGQAVAEFGRLDVLVGNAGMARIAPVGDLDVEDWPQ